MTQSTVDAARPGASEVDAVIVVSFGGPEAPDDVMPFLRRVTAGRNVPDDRLAVVAEHYLARGGVSPINRLNRDLIAGLTRALEQAGLGLPVYWGNRNAAPFLDEAIAQMAADRVDRALAFVTSAYGSYSGCRQYRENLAGARAAAGPAAPVIEKLRPYYDHPGFVEPLVDGLGAALAGRDPLRTQVLFTAHSIPVAAADNSPYAGQVAAAAGLVAQRVDNMAAWSVVWQSRSGPPSVPWLEPDIVDAIEALDATAVDDVVVVPVGFVSDHMEVIQDLDIAAAAAAARCGFGFERIATSGTDPRFIDMVVELIRECTEAIEPRRLDGSGLGDDWCSAKCCLLARPAMSESS